MEIQYNLTSHFLGYCEFYLPCNSKIWYAQRFFKRAGIATPKINFISGNFLEILENVGPYPKKNSFFLQINAFHN